MTTSSLFRLPQGVRSFALALRGPKFNISYFKVMSQRIQRITDQFHYCHITIEL